MNESELYRIIVNTALTGVVMGTLFGLIVSAFSKR